ncbi:MAG: ferrochelatase [Deltaproteobacteria bacterium RIFOXYD12_FULL_57_12]|nr:MAG: ferrochelatase [Deltaproteobacteria bacterium RIFOXYD12_FULL_57_12]
METTLPLKLASSRPTIGVILLNLGGPEKPADVRPFLYNLFSDRQIIRLGPRLLQKPLAWLIASRRAAKSRAAYACIGGGSPLMKITAEQGRALAEQLSGHGSFRVVMAMRYWRPDADAALRELAAAGIRRAVALPLYPHYSRATTGSSLEDLRRAVGRLAGNLALAEIREWPDQSGYIDCLAAAILQGVRQLPAGESQVVYSAHSLPVSFIKEGDPYLVQIERTIKAVERITGLAGRLCFQSRSGPVEWLAPSTPEMLEQLAREGCRNILMVPISFVSDHVETLYEIDILYRQQAERLGMRLARTESLNVAPPFIAALRDLVLDAVNQQGW